MTTFHFATCQVGAEPALKDEVQAAWPALRAAFQRPGLVTFKPVTPVPGPALLAPIFGRVSGLSLGMAKSAAEVLEHAAVVAQADNAGKPLHLHVFASDILRPGARSEAAETAREVAVEAVRQALADGGGVFANGRPAAGAAVLDVILPPPRAHDDAAPSEPLFVGWHRHQPPLLPYPGGSLPLETPAMAPSQAWRKIEEAMVVTGFVPTRGEAALELGAAPGGAVHALLMRGVATTAVDPQPMDPRIERLALVEDVFYRNLRATLAEVTLEDLPRHIDWMVVDAHLASPVVLKQLARYFRWYEHSLRGLFWTVKLHRWSDAAKLPELMERLKSFGFDEVGARQLPSNGQEVLVWAATRRGLTRRARRA